MTTKFVEQTHGKVKKKKILNSMQFHNFWKIETYQVNNVKTYSYYIYQSKKKFIVMILRLCAAAVQYNNRNEKTSAR